MNIFITIGLFLLTGFCFGQNNESPFLNGKMRLPLQQKLVNVRRRVGSIEIGIDNV